MRAADLDDQMTSGELGQIEVGIVHGWLLSSRRSVIQWSAYFLQSIVVRFVRMIFDL